MVLAKNLRYLRKSRGFSQEHIANKLNYKSFTTIQKWESGISEPSVEKLKLLADIYNVSMDLLLTEDIEIVTSNSATSFLRNSKASRSIPVLGNVPAGIPLEAIENILDYEEISQDMSDRGEYFGLIVHGDSMEPKFSEGDVVIVRKQSVLESGEIGIIIVNGTDATIKKFVAHDEGGISLIPLNPKYAPKYYTDGEIDTVPIRVLGKVVELRAKF